MSPKWRTVSVRFKRQLHRWRLQRGLHALDPGDQEPLRAALFGAEQMEAHGRALAAMHRVVRAPSGAGLLQQLKDNERELNAAVAVLMQMLRDEVRINPAGEWLLDNFYLVEEQIRMARRHLPDGYSRELPHLQGGHSDGLPRVYGLAREAITHGDGRIDAVALSRFIAAYQTITPLTLGELWAFPIMLRLALIDNLRRMAMQVVRDGEDHRLAGDWANRLNRSAASSPKGVVLVVADMARSSPPLSGAFVAELKRGLQGRGTVLSMPTTWIEQWVTEAGHSVEALVQAESQRQAADRVSISNSIGSLRFLDQMNWREFVETMSMVERLLRQDPAGIYARMDFSTRDAYRHVIERLARRSALGEVKVAALVLELAQQIDAGEVGAHVGYYLVDEGLAQARVHIGASALPPKTPRQMKRMPLRTPLAWYLLPIAVCTVLFSAALLLPAQRAGFDGVLLWLSWALAIVTFSELAIVLVNWLATLIVPPRALPRMDLSDGIPADCRTLVVIPSMTGNLAEVEALCDALEVRFLANRDDHLHFALLTDFPDATQEVMPEDAPVLAHALGQIERLNARYAPEQGERFFLFHRPRRWNEGERCWMGHERKRGKLAALNRLLRQDPSVDACANDFQAISGNTKILGNIRYVITLDSDTQLPRDAARKFVGSMSHPLNRPRLDAGERRIERGYGILQPSIGSSMSRGAESRYTAMFGSEPGIDPYTRTISDVYQDLFAEGSFIGKGIYDVDAFEQVLADRFPVNRILSHDLLEGCYARSGLISDVPLFESHPTRYLAEAKRHARWIRGDWQLLPWLMRSVPLSDGGYERNPLSWLSRGKLLDNLRRSVVPIAAMLLLVAGWMLSPTPLRWTLWVLGLWVLPVLLPALHAALMPPPDVALSVHLRQVAAGCGRQLLRTLVSIACLPHAAGFSAMAIARTLWRMAISRRHLLQWNPSSEVERSLQHGRHAEWRAMAIAPLLAVAVGVALSHVAKATLWIASPLLLAWAVSPLLMEWLGNPSRRRGTHLAPTQLAFLGRLARRTWGFFEYNFSEEDHWLPPDNVQEYPAVVVAHRTSPTNIGLGLLANLAAYDLGYIPSGEVVERTRRTLATLETLPRHRGHFYNWYDTQTLLPLPPRYVSTVDSGNLAGHLLTLRQGLLGLIDAPVVADALLSGLADTLGVLQQDAASDLPVLSACDPLAQALAELRAGGVSRSLHRIEAFLANACIQAEAIVRAAASSDALVAGAARALAQACQVALAELHQWQPVKSDATTGLVAPTAEAIPTLRQLREDCAEPALRLRASERIQSLEKLAHQAGQFAQMEFGFLYDRARHLLSIGYNVDERRLDAGQYDLLASEARLCNFVAIAQGQLPQESWFALGRMMTEVEGGAALLSWSGSMFEYLMPQLVMPSYPDTLLDRTAQHVVSAQIAYGERSGVPWGISESGYNSVDVRLNYQYRAFGVPGLGLRRGLGQDLVVAPYASTMALMVAPGAACRNLQRLSEQGFGGRFGLYEAIDYTPARVPRGQEHVLVRSFMSHHQGMALLSLDYLLRGQPMQQRFVADAQFQATLLLLQERVPRGGVFHPHEVESNAGRSGATDTETQLRIIADPDRTLPAVQLLSNGRYHGMLSSAGSGYSRQRDMAVTRWREDATRDHWGTFCYLRDVDSGEVWSATHQPTCVPMEGYEAIFSDAKAEFRGRKYGYSSHMEIAISAEDDVELRRLRITNRSRHRRVIEITTYAEVVLAPALADELHPAFSNLFVQSEILADKQALLCTRRARSHDEVAPWMFHLVAVHDADIAAISYETDRAQFLGRGNTPRMPQAMVSVQALSGSAGSVLDPIVAIRCRIELAPEQRAQIDMVYGVGADRQACSTLVDKYRDRRLADRVFNLALTHSQVVRRQIDASQADALLYERLAGLVLYANPVLRADPEVLLQNHRGQSGLWGHAISGDLPIVLLRIADTGNIELVRQMVQAHAYWRLKGLRADLVIWNESQAGYRQQLQDQILGMVSVDPEANVLDRPGGIFVRPAEQISYEDRVLLLTVARAIIDDQHGTLATQLDRHFPADRALPGLLVDRDPMQMATPALELPAPILVEGAQALPSDPAQEQVSPTALMFDNGTGGFTADGQEYVIDQGEGECTPAPWSNVIANAQFGTVLSESACGYSWFENAHEYRLTPWHNDPVTDSGGEAFYLRDEDSGKVWSPMALPCRGSGSYRTRHGFGYSVYEHVEDGIASELWVYVDLVHPVKYMRLLLRNESGRTRRLSATGYVEWVLGDTRGHSQMHVVSEVREEDGIVTARNPYNTEFEGRVAFFDVDASTRGFTNDRREFLGRNGDPAAPLALRRERLSGHLATGGDPCAALQVPITLDAGGYAETVFRLGAAQSGEQALVLAQATRGSEHATQALAAVRDYWRQTLGVVQVSSPDPAVDLLANGWLLYQTLACRYLGRSGYYQSGGAFGFRDQLQDSMALVHAQPALVRKHLLLSASQQFMQGDVLHWWHPPQGRGVRTRCSDDYLWLPVATCRYVELTGDRSVLGEMVRFIDGRALNVDEESHYDLPHNAGSAATLYQHCALGLRRACELLGVHGLPLIGSGDWNDGLNRIGLGGRGESVWLGFFLVDALRRFEPLASLQPDRALADFCRERAELIEKNLQVHGWDGEWYRRAWFDDGTPLGSRSGDECRIDSIAQSWSVLSGVAGDARGVQAMESLYRYLVKPDTGVIQLLDPPFDRIEHDPGYIRGYVPGVRENGGQYTHAAVWAAMAFAELGDNERAWELAGMINPVHHARDAQAVRRYKVEPYVLAADVYAVAPHQGRGGWTWYTGSAGWMYRLLTESLLGLYREGSELLLKPCIPSDWTRYQLRYRHGGTDYVIEVEQSELSHATLWLDDQPQPALRIGLQDDGKSHRAVLHWPRSKI